MSAAALAQSTGLSVDNTEALGVLNADAITEADIVAGRFDGAEVEAWLVNWSAPENRLLQFRGVLGEIERVGAAFRAELRGLAEVMNQPGGRLFQRQSTELLGDDGTRFDYDAPGFSEERAVSAVEEGRVLLFEGFNEYEPRWFERGRVEVLTGAAKGLVGIVKNDRLKDGLRRVELWEELRAAIAPGDMVRLEAGFDGSFEMCRLKFNNALNFRGFPDIPGDDWTLAYPSNGAAPKDGSSRR